MPRSFVNHSLKSCSKSTAPELPVLPNIEDKSSRELKLKSSNDGIDTEVVGGGGTAGCTAGVAEPLGACAGVVVAVGGREGLFTG